MDTAEAGALMAQIGHTHDPRSGEVILAEGTPGDLTLVFAGDFYGGNRTGELCRSGDYAGIFNDMLPVLREKDLSVVNLESPLTTGTDPIPKDGPHLRADPRCAEALRFAGFDVASVANNHILDHGAGGLLDTLEVCGRAGLRTVGAGVNLEEAGSTLFLEVKGTRLAFIGITENEFSIASEHTAGANPLEPVRNYYQISAAKEAADAVIVMVHGGHEMFPYPSPRMVRTYRYFADLGAAAVIGHHPHCASGFEVHSGVPIFYSLGNFIFDAEEADGEGWNRGYLVRLSIGRNRVARFSIHPYEQSAGRPGGRLLAGGERAAYLEAIRRYSETIADGPALERRWREFCGSRELLYLKEFMGLRRLDVALVRRGLRLPSILRQERMVQLLNYIRCEAHRDLAVQSLKGRIAPGESSR